MLAIQVDILIYWDSRGTREHRRSIPAIIEHDPINAGRNKDFIFAVHNIDLGSILQNKLPDKGPAIQQDAARDLGAKRG